MREAQGPTRLFVVRNTNGGILGGYHELGDAEACKAYWERRYAQCELVGDVGVSITEIGGRE